MTIECNSINQVINQLLIAFEDCNKIKNSDLRRLVELVSAVNVCSNGGTHYDTLISETYTPIVDQVVSYPIGSFHSITIIIVSGKMVYNTFTFNAGTTQNIEVTTLNQTELTFTAKAGCEILVQRLIETI